MLLMLTKHTTKRISLMLLTLGALLSHSYAFSSDAGGVAESKGTPPRPSRKLTPVLLEAPELATEALPERPASVKTVVSKVTATGTKRRTTAGGSGGGAAAVDQVQALNAAINAADLAGVEQALRNGANPNTPSTLPISQIVPGLNGEPLYEGAEDEAVKFVILEAGVPALFRAVALPDPSAPELVKLLISHGADVNAKAMIGIDNADNAYLASVPMIALMNSINLNYQKLLQILFESGATLDDNAKKVLEEGIREITQRGDSQPLVEYLQQLLSSASSTSAVNTAASGGGSAAAVTDQVQALNAAINAADLAGVEQALRNGANPNAPSTLPISTIVTGFNGKPFDERDDSEESRIIPLAAGTPALFRAVALPNSVALEITRRLVENGADVNATATLGFSSADNAHLLSVLTIATMNSINPRYLELLQLLRRSGAEPDNNSQATLNEVFRNAIEIGRERIGTDYLQQLLDLGAQINTAFEDKDSALLAALEALAHGWRTDHRLIKWLIDRGADVNQRSIYLDQHSGKPISTLSIAHRLTDAGQRRQVLQYLTDAGAVDNDLTRPVAI